MKIAHIEWEKKPRTLGKVQKIRDLERVGLFHPFKNTRYVYCQLVYQIHLIQCSVRVWFVSPLCPHASQEKVKQWLGSPFAGITAVLRLLNCIAIEHL